MTPCLNHYSKFSGWTICYADLFWPMTTRKHQIGEPIWKNVAYWQWNLPSLQFHETHQQYHFLDRAPLNCKQSKLDFIHWWSPSYHGCFLTRAKEAQHHQSWIVLQVDLQNPQPVKAAFWFLSIVDRKHKQNQKKTRNQCQNLQ